MIEFLKSNISWLKDLFTLILTGTGTVVTILTYRRAKATILQPIRSEVVKKQTDLLSEFLQLLFVNGQSFETGLDYKEIAETNSLMLLDDYAFKDKFKMDALKQAKENLQGAVFTKNKLEKFHLIKPFGVSPHRSETSAEIQERLLKGEVKITIIHTTKKHKEFVSKLDYYLNHPFTPTSIQTTIKSLKEDISYNLSTVLTEVLEAFVIELPNEVKQDPNVKVNITGVSNEFNHRRRPHKKYLEELVKNIRNHLRIDEQWIS